MSKKIKVIENIVIERTMYEYQGHSDAFSLNPDIEGIHFCIRALKKQAKTDKRPHIRHLFVKDNLMVATDGSRLHEYRLKAKIPDGFYSVVLKHKKHIVLAHEPDINMDLYPKWEEILPTEDQFNIDSKEIRDVIVTDDRTNLTLYQLNNMADFPVNYKYIEDMENGMTLKYFSNDKNMFYFINYEGTMKALIMGMKL